MKNKILIPLLIVAGLAAFFSFRYSGKMERSSQSKRKLVIETVMKTLLNGHFSPRDVDDSFSVHVYNKFLSDMDGSKLFFTKQDMKVIEKFKFDLDDEIKGNSTVFFDTVDAIFIRRMASAEKYYQDILEKPFTFNTNESLELNADKEEYAANETELIARWRLFLKYRTLVKYVDLKADQEKRKENNGKENKESVAIKDTTRFKTDAELEATAREDVKKLYTRIFKSYKKQKDDDRFTIFINAITEIEDPHTEYLPPVEKKQFDEMMSGSFVGIGAVLNPANDKVTVSSIITGSPSWKQGELKVGDEILKVAHEASKPATDIAGMELDEVVKLIRGDKGTEVKLTVKKPDGGIKVISIIRDVVEKEETFAKSAIIKGKDGLVGYILLPEFYADFNHTSGRSCAVDVRREVVKLMDAGVTGIILDLRYNGGGSLGDVVDMAGIFIGKGPVVQVKSTHSSPTVLPAKPSGDTALYNGPLAIMVNAGSASASEILAAVLQDYRRAVIVGSMTYGKGTVQKMVSLDDMVDAMTRMRMMQSDTDGVAGTGDAAVGGSIGSIKLTMEKFYRVNGSSTQLKGVTPDIAIPDVYDGYDDEELGERNRKSALAWDEIPSATYKPKNSILNMQQLQQLSQSRVSNHANFRQIQENAQILKSKRSVTTVSLNETKYRKEQEEANARSKKNEELEKSLTTLEITNPAADMYKINLDSASITKNEDWKKARAKDIYIAEAVNIINDMAKSGMHVNIGTGMKR